MDPVSGFILKKVLRMKIGNIDIGNKLILAPMAEVTDSSFRKICKEHGVGLTFTQMVSAQGVVTSNFQTLRLHSYHRSEKPIGVQFLGNDPGILGEAVKEILKFNPDLIDLNCGCPVDKVVNNCMGAYLMDDPKRIGKIVRRMVDSSNGTPISIKTRLGKDKNHHNVLEVAKTVEENGASLIFVHARTRVDKYESDVDYSLLKEVKNNVKIPVVGNGSMFNPQDIKKMIDETGCDSALIARGALGNPFIFDRYNSLIENGFDSGMPEIEIVKNVLLKHLKFLEEEYGNPVCLDKAKKQTVWYFRNYPGIELLLNIVFGLKSLEDLRSVILEHAEKFNGSVQSSETDDAINKKFKKKVLFWLAEVNDETLG